MKDSVYTAEFTLVRKDSPARVKAQASFGYGRDGWYLQSFAYGQAPNVEVVQIDENPN